MPIYEFYCAHCRRKFRKLVGVVAQNAPLACPHCQATDLQRLLSRFGRLRSEDEALDSLTEELEAAGDTDDPKTLRRLMHEVGREMGEDLGDEFDQAMEEEASGIGMSETDSASDTTP